MLPLQLLRTAGAIGLALVIILSLVPGSYRPHTGFPGGIEHLAAYALTACALGCGWPARMQRFAITLSLLALACLMEVFQLWVPSRSPEAVTVVISGLGGLLGVVTAAFSCALRDTRATTKIGSE